MAVDLLSAPKRPGERQRCAKGDKDGVRRGKLQVPMRFYASRADVSWSPE